MQVQAKIFWFGRLFLEYCTQVYKSWHVSNFKMMASRKLIDNLVIDLLRSWNSVAKISHYRFSPFNQNLGPGHLKEEYFVIMGKYFWVQWKLLSVKTDLEQDLYGLFLAQTVETLESRCSQ